MSETHYAYVPHHKQKQFEALGWVFDTDLGYPHAAYASYYRWPNELGEVRYPIDDPSRIKEKVKYDINDPSEINADDYQMGGA